MTDHRREAERLAAQANHYTYGDGADSAAGQALATEGLVHAVLALTATQTPQAGVDHDQHNTVVADLTALRKVVARHIFDGLTSPDPVYEDAVRDLQSAMNKAGLDLGGELDHLADARQAGNDTPKGESTQPPAEQFVPRTERSYWQTIADALNASAAVGMHVGIDLDGTLTDHQAWSVVWDRSAEQWAVAGYNDDHGSIEDVYSASELHEMDQDAEFQHDAAEEAYDAERGEDE